MALVAPRTGRIGRRVRSGNFPRRSAIISRDPASCSPCTSYFRYGVLGFMPPAFLLAILGRPADATGILSEFLRGRRFNLGMKNIPRRIGDETDKTGKPLF